MRRIVASLAAALSIQTSAAQEAASPELPRRFTGSLEIAVSDKYIYHGYVFENQGAIVQPEIEVLGLFYSVNSSCRPYRTFLGRVEIALPI